jgi:hypothetical protein
MSYTGINYHPLHWWPRLEHWEITQPYHQQAVPACSSAAAPLRQPLYGSSSTAAPLRQLLYGSSSMTGHLRRPLYSSPSTAASLRQSLYGSPSTAASLWQPAGFRPLTLSWSSTARDFNLLQPLQLAYYSAGVQLHPPPDSAWETAGLYMSWPHRPLSRLAFPLLTGLS